jgi:hypothetical protein
MPRYINKGEIGINLVNGEHSLPRNGRSVPGLEQGSVGLRVKWIPGVVVKAGNSSMSSWPVG